MKKISILSLLFMAVLLLGGCHTQIDSDLRVLERRIEKLEQRCEDMNTTLQGLKTLLDNLTQYEFITDVQPFNKGGKSGYTISFTHADPIVLYNGTDAETPILGVGKGEDGVWYWTVRYPSESQATFVTDNFGLRIPCDAGSPLIKIENGHWMVSYDNGDIWHDLGRATGEDGASFFSSVVDKGDYIEFNLLNGTTIQAPTWASFEKLQENCRKTNENVENFTQLVTQLREKVYVQDMIPIMSGLDTIGMKLRLSDGHSYSFYNGQGTNVPVIGAQRATPSPDDNVWFWTIKYGNASQWILDENGEKIQANAPDGKTPHISLQQVEGDPAWYWAVAYGDEAPAFLLFDGAKVQASVVAPEAVVQGVVQVAGDMVRITLAEGLSVLVPLPKAIQVNLSAPVTASNILVIASGETLSFHCTVVGGDAQTAVLPLTDEYFYASATTTNHVDWTVTVTAPSPFKAPSVSKLNLLVSNGYGQMKTIIITLQPAN